VPASAGESKFYRQVDLGGYFGGVWSNAYFKEAWAVMLNFGTSGLRGLVTDMTDRECYINARGFLEALQENREIKLGDQVSLAGDLRASTDRILLAVAQAILDAGCQLDYCGKIPSPALAYQGFQNQRASIMVTGSHIPDDRNGIKFNKPDSEILKSDEARILTAVARVRAQVEGAGKCFNAAGGFMPGSAPVLPAPNPTAEEGYVRRYLDVFPTDFLKGKKIVFEQHSAVGRDLAARVLAALGAQVVTEGRTDYFVPKDTENVTAETCANFHRLVKKHSPFALVSTDGDSDRPFVVDEQGRFNRGDELGAVVADFLGTQAAVVPVSANDAVSEFLKEKSIALTLTRIGSPYVVAGMNAAKAAGAQAVVGWEANGGFLTATPFSLFGKNLAPLPTRDALLPILCALGAACKCGSVSAAFARLPQRFTQAGLLDNFPIAISQKLMLGLLRNEPGVVQLEFKSGMALSRRADGSVTEIPETPDIPGAQFWLKLGNIWDVKRVLERRYFKSELGYGSVAALNLIDGVRIVFSQGDVAHVRPSGNAPQLRIYSNASTQARADEIVRQGLSNQGILRTMEADIRATEQL